jgi:glycosyltransferase involved in cell wall biosynthesis
MYPASTPDISIVVPIYGIPSNYLRNCIESLTNQTLKNIEIILVDDGNKDESPQICNDYAEKDSRIVVVHQANQGVSVARNAGIKIAKAPYIAFIDADDWTDKETFEVALKHMVSKSVDVVTWEFRAEDKSKHSTISSRNLEDIKVSLFDKKEEIEKIQRAVLGGNVEIKQRINGAPYGKLYKKRIIEQYNIHFKAELKRSQDNEFNFMYFEYVKKAIHIPVSFYHYVKYENSATLRYNSNSEEIMDLFLSEISSNLKKLTKGSVFYKDFNYIVVHKFADICRTCYAHPNNPSTVRDKIRGIKNLANQPYFSLAFKEVKGKTFKKILKVVVPLVQLKLFGLVYFSFLFRSYIKR